MKCPNCNKEVADGSKFCNHCGSPIKTLIACTNKDCPDYGKKILPPDSKFCPSCGCEIRKSKDASVFMSFHNIILGETNIYDIDADEYQKTNESVFGDVKVIAIKDVEYEGNTITCTARQSNKKIFSYYFDSLSDIDIPESWTEAGLDIDNVLLSMEKMLCKQNFQWEEFEDPYDGTVGFAYKETESGLFLVFGISEDKLVISLLTEEMKNSLKNGLENDYNDDEEEDDSDEDEKEVPSCPECGSDDVDDDGSDYLQYTCNECGHNWGHDDTVECPECGSNDVENDGTDNLQYECNSCGHMWGDDDEDNDEDYNDDDIKSKLFPVCGITLGETSEYDIKNKKYLFAELEYCDSGLVIAWSKNRDGSHGAQIRQERNDENFTNIYITHSDDMFEKWKSLGFSWSLSFDRWIELFEKLGFDIEIEKYPEKSYYESKYSTNRNCLSACFKAVSSDGYLIFTLDFDYGNEKGEGYSTSSRNSLYSIDLSTSDSTYERD